MPAIWQIIRQLQQIFMACAIWTMDITDGFISIEKGVSLCFS